MQNIPDKNTPDATPQLKRCLTGIDLIFLGIGAIVGAGIFIITGIAAATKAGPAIIVSYIVAGIACAFTALSYAELAAAIKKAGSAYTYALEGFGIFVGWIIGWDLILEYLISVSAVSVGWSAYVTDLIKSIHIHLPSYLLSSPFAQVPGIINLPALVVVTFITTLLAIGIKQSSRFNLTVVSIKLSVVAIFIVLAASHFNISNWHPFMPFGWSGVMGAAGLIFFSYIGFDAVSTAAEETINPQRNLPIGILGSLIVCSFLYIAVSGLLTGMTSYTNLNVEAPVSETLLKLGYTFSGSLTAVGAICGLTTVILVMFYGLTRVLFAMSRDGLLPRQLSKIYPSTHTPLQIIISCGIVVAILSGFLPMIVLVEIANIGTLAAFTIVCAGVIILRYTRPDMERPFKVPFCPWVPLLGIATCLYLIYSLTTLTWLRFIIWMVIGLVIYFSYSRKSYYKLQRSVS